MEEEKRKEVLEVLQKLQDDFAEIIGAAIVVTVNSKGEPILQSMKKPKICEMIMSTERGKRGCEETAKFAISQLGKREEPLIAKCHAGYAAVFVPIKIDGETVGAVAACGGLYEEDAENLERFKEKARKLAEEFGVENVEEFAEEATKHKIVSESEIRARIEMLLSSIEELSQKMPIKEVLTA